MATQRISVYNLAELKTTSDDAIANYLNSLKFKQSHVLMDTRLALGYSSFTIAGACWYWDHKLGFDATKLYTAVAVALYAILNCALTGWIWLWERGTIYEGIAPSGDKIVIATATKKHIPTYNVFITVTPPSGKDKTVSWNFSRSFADWFDGQGSFITHRFQEMLATAIPLVGKLDAAHVKTESQKLIAESPEVLDALLKEAGADMTPVVDASAKATGTEGKRGSKKRRG